MRTSESETQVGRQMRLMSKSGTHGYTYKVLSQAQVNNLGKVLNLPVNRSAQLVGIEVENEQVPHVPQEGNGSSEKVLIESKGTKACQLIELGRNSSHQTVGTDKEFFQALQGAKLERKGTRKSVLLEVNLGCDNNICM